MIDSLTARMISNSNLPSEVESLEQLLETLRDLMQKAKLAEWSIHSAIRTTKLALIKAGVPTTALLEGRRSTRFDTKLLTLAELQQELGISRGTLIKVRKDPTFPKPVRISGRRLAYLSREVGEWVSAGGLRAEPQEGCQVS